MAQKKMVMMLMTLVSIGRATIFVVLYVESDQSTRNEIHVVRPAPPLSLGNDDFLVFDNENWTRRRRKQSPLASLAFVSSPSSSSWWHGRWGGRRNAIFLLPSNRGTQTEKKLSRAIDTVGFNLLPTGSTV